MSIYLNQRILFPNLIVVIIANRKLPCGVIAVKVVIVMEDVSKLLLVAKVMPFYTKGRDRQCVVHVLLMLASVKQ